jgi:hypothetical protein
MTEEDLSSLVEKLQARRFVVVSNTKVTYELPPKSV